jgi:uncharacterized protein involved in exopolysaccharide biosynthesis
MLVGSIAAFFALVGVAVYLTRPITYAAEAGALLQDPRSTIDTRGSVSKGDADRYVADQVAIMKSDDVVVRAAARMRKLKGTTPLTVGELRRAMSIQTDLGSSWVSVRVKADDRVTARYAADSVIYAYRVRTKDDVAAKTRAALRKLDLSIAAVAHLMAKPRRTAAQQATALALIQQLRGRRNRIEVDGQLAGDGVAVFSPAENGKRQGAPLFASTLIGLVLGGLVGCGIAYLIEAVKTRRLTQQGPAGPTPVAARVRDVPAVDGSAPGPIVGEPGAEPVAQPGRRWA